MGVSSSRGFASISGSGLYPIEGFRTSRPVFSLAVSPKRCSSERILCTFEAWVKQSEHGWGVPGQTFQSLPEEIRRTVREETRRSIGNTGRPIEVEMMFASGRK
jgi:hypothetical protein